MKSMTWLCQKSVPKYARNPRLATADHRISRVRNGVQRGSNEKLDMHGYDTDGQSLESQLEQLRNVGCSKIYS